MFLKQIILPSEWARLIDDKRSLETRPIIFLLLKLKMINDPLPIRSRKYVCAIK